MFLIQCLDFILQKCYDFHWVLGPSQSLEKQGSLFPLSCNSISPVAIVLELAAHLPFIPYLFYMHPGADYRDVQSLDTPWGFPKTYPRVAPASYLSQRLFKVENHNQGNKKNLSILFMTFGQFLDHDLALVPKGEECKNKE